MDKRLLVSVIVPALNAEAGIPQTIPPLAAQVAEVIVVDGGSSDGTGEAASSAGAMVVEAERGRGTQLATGAEHAAQEWLLFLHADTRLAPGWVEAASRFIGDESNRHFGGYWRFRLDDPSPKARRLERMVAWRCRRFGLPYGDQGLLVHRSLYDKAGGFRHIPLMEDVDLVCRIGRRNTVMLDADAITSAVRYRRDGYWLRPMRNLCLLSLFFLGVPPRLLVRLYG